MRIAIEMVDGFMISPTTGKSSKSRVARLEYQPQPRAKKQVANLLVEKEDPAVVLEAAAAYLRSVK